MSRRDLLAWSTATTAGITLVVARNPAHTQAAPTVVHGAASATPPASGPGAASGGGTGPGGRGAVAARGGTVTAAWTHVHPVYRIADLMPGAPADAVALTIDDGPHPVWTPRILDVLRRNDVRATFSLIGEQAHAQPRLVRRILAEGHAVCNHSMTHPMPFGRRPPGRIRSEIVDAQSVIVAAGGTPPRLFRSPGGDWSPAVLTAAKGLGMVPVAWDVDPRDWSRPGTGPIVSSLSAARPGDILLCHDGGGNRSQTVAALRLVLPRLRARGLAFVPLGI